MTRSTGTSMQGKLVRTMETKASRRKWLKSLTPFEQRMWKKEAGRKGALKWTR